MLCYVILYDIKSYYITFVSAGRPLATRFAWSPIGCIDLTPHI